ncbi:bifunctional 3-(3-hydroxy-phenyl)propionate/3-hydroxycinnamic acid hydroxylase MhpA [Williamsia sp. SKLECPSW1]
MGQSPVIIVGAGPTGLTAAAVLADHGVASIVLERWDGVYPQPRAVHLDDEVYRILGRVGVADEFAQISRPARGLRLVTSSLGVIAEFRRDPDAGPHGFPAASMFDQPELEGLLRTAVARRSDMITMRSGVEVVDMGQNDHGVTVTATDRDTGDAISVTGSYLLGCDGAGSRTRSAIGSDWRDLGFSQRWLVIDVETTADLRQWEGVHQVCDTRRAATYMRIGDTRYRWEFQLLDDESADDFSDIASVTPLLRPWLGEAAESELTLIRAAEYTFRARVADRWRDRRMFLLGDAAHLTPPFIGQGMGAGLRDAANLGWKLAAVLAGEVPAETLDSYAQERIPHVTHLVRLAVATGAAMTGGGRGGDVIRGVAAPLFARLPALSSRLTDSATPPLHRSAYVRRGRLAGRLAPNAVVTADGRRLDEVGRGFRVVTADAPTDEQEFEITRRGARTVVVEPRSPLGRWLATARVRAAIVRPDGTVMVAGPSVAAVYTVLPTIASPASTDTTG